MSTNTTSTYKIFTDIDLAKNDIFNVSKIIGDNLNDTSINKNLEISTADRDSSNVDEFGNLILRAGAKDTSSNIGGDVRIYAGIAEGEGDKKGAFVLPTTARGITLYPNSAIDVLVDSTVAGSLRVTVNKEIFVDSPHINVESVVFDSTAGSVDTTALNVEALVGVSNLEVENLVATITTADIEIVGTFEYDSMDTTINAESDNIHITDQSTIIIEDVTSTIATANIDISSTLDYDSTNTAVIVNNDKLIITGSSTATIGIATTTINEAQVNVSTLLDYDSTNTTVVVNNDKLTITSSTATIGIATTTINEAQVNVSTLLDYDSTNTTVVVNNDKLIITGSSTATIGIATTTINEAQTSVSGILDYDSTNTTVVVNNDKLTITSSTATIGTANTLIATANVTISNVLNYNGTTTSLEITESTVEIKEAQVTIGEVLNYDGENASLNISNLTTTVGRASVDILNADILSNGGSTTLNDLDIKTGTGWVRETGNKEFYTPVNGIATSSTTLYDSNHTAVSVTAGANIDGLYAKIIYPATASSLRITTTGVGSSTNPFISTIESANGLKISTTTDWKDTSRHDPYESYVETHNLKVNGVMQGRGFAMYWDDDSNSLIFTKGDILEGDLN